MSTPKEERQLDLAHFFTAKGEIDRNTYSQVTAGQGWRRGKEREGREMWSHERKQKRRKENR